MVQVCARHLAAVAREHAGRRRRSARRSSPSRARAFARRRRRRRPRARGCRRRCSRPSGRAVGSSGRGSLRRRRSRRSRPPSRARRSGARGPACRAPPMAARASRDPACTGETVAVVRPGRERRRDVGQRADVRDQPRLGAVREIGIGEQVDGRAVLDRDARRLDRGVEALRRARRGDHGHRATRRCGRTAPSADPPARASSACLSRGRRAGCRGSAAAARA